MHAATPSDPTPATYIDADAFRRQLVEDNIEHWHVVVQQNGFLAPALDRQWTLAPTRAQQATPVSQARLILVFAAGYDLTGEPKYQDAVRSGADFLLNALQDKSHGGVVWAVSPTGRVLDTAKKPYGHAFAILGLTHAYRVTQEARYRDAAIQIWQTMKEKLRDEHGGVFAAEKPDFSSPQQGRSQNPVMHTFEALLALYEVTGDEQIGQDAKDLLAWVKEHIYQSDDGYFAESFDDAWQPLPHNANGRVNVGHQFEWAYLLSEAVRLGFDEENLQLGMKLLNYGLEHGYDARTGSVYDEVDYQGRPEPGDASRGWWQQCELLRAVMRYAACHGRADLWPEFQKAWSFTEKHFIDPDHGGWYEEVRLDDPEKSKRHKGSIWKAGYHETNMYLEGLKLTDGI